MPYSRRKDAADFLEMMASVYGAGDPIWGETLGSNIADIANAKFDDNADKDLWRRRYLHAKRAKDPALKKINDRIRLAMKAKGIKTIYELATITNGLSKSMLTNRLNGSSQWSHDELEYIEEALKLEPGDLEKDWDQGDLPLIKEMKSEESMAEKIPPSNKETNRADKMPEYGPLYVHMPPMLEDADIITVRLPAPSERILKDQIACAAQILRDEWRRYKKSKEEGKNKWCNPHAVHTALQVLEGKEEPF
jgi:hypothetical protein